MSNPRSQRFLREAQRAYDTGRSYNRRRSRSTVPPAGDPLPPISSGRYGPPRPRTFGNLREITLANYWPKAS